MRPRVQCIYVLVIAHRLLCSCSCSSSLVVRLLRLSSSIGARRLFGVQSFDLFLFLAVRNHYTIVPTTVNAMPTGTYFITFVLSTVRINQLSFLACFVRLARISYVVQSSSELFKGELFSQTQSLLYFFLYLYISVFSYIWSPAQAS